MPARSGPQDTSLDSILFRAHPSIIKIKRGSPAIVHPVLEATWLTYLDLRCAIVNNYTTDTEHNVCELRCRKEFATSPATKRLVIDMGPGLKIKKKKGVKVKHVLRAVCEMWEKPVSEELIRRKRFKRKDPFRCEEEEPITWWDLYGERRSWAGWETLEVRKDGEVTLKNREFDWT